MARRVMDVVAVGARLRRLREARGLTTVALAERAGVSRETVWRVEAGRQRTPEGTLERLALALGATAWHLKGSPRDPVLDRLLTAWPALWPEARETVTQIVEIAARGRAA